MDPFVDAPESLPELCPELEHVANAATMAGHGEWADLMRRAGSAIRRLRAENLRLHAALLGPPDD